MNYDKAIAGALLDSGAFKISFDPLFTWTSGLKSPVYCDLRALTGSVEARNLVVDAFVALAEGMDIDVVAGTATAGISWAAWVADRLNKPMVYVRGAAKGHGTQKRIEGLLEPGRKVLLVEDHISTGGSSISAVDALREEGHATVTDVFSINTYGLAKADDNFASAHVKLTTVTNYGVILDLALERGVIDEEKAEMLRDFVQDMAGWAQKYNLA